jgi:hypothetical protein
MAKVEFEYIANFFDASLVELSRRNAEVETDFQRVDAIRFMAVAYTRLWPF